MKRALVGMVLAVMCFGYVSCGGVQRNPDVQESVDRENAKVPANAFVINEDGTCTWRDYVRLFRVKNVESVQDAYNAVRDEVQLGKVVRSGIRKEYEQYSRRCTRVEIRKAMFNGEEGFEVTAFYDPVEVPPIKL